MFPDISEGLRETHRDFLEFVRGRAGREGGFIMGPSDQGAYLEFYHAHKNLKRVSPANAKRVTKADYEPSTYVRYLDATFNVKPYYKNEDTFRRRKVVHFNGLKPRDIMRGLMGHQRGDFAAALHILLPMVFSDDHHFLCLTLHDFAVSMAAGKEKLDRFCQFAFSSNVTVGVCQDSFLTLSKQQEQFDCVSILQSRGFRTDTSLMIKLHGHILNDKTWKRSPKVEQLKA